MGDQVSESVRLRQSLIDIYNTSRQFPTETASRTELVFLMVQMRGIIADTLGLKYPLPDKLDNLPGVEPNRRMKK